MSQESRTPKWSSKDAVGRGYEDTSQPLVHKGDEISVISGEAVLETEVKPYLNYGDVERARADAFLELVEAGEKPSIAAKELGSNLREMKRDPLVQERLERVVQDFKLTAQERKELLRARLNEIMLAGKDSDAIAAAKLVAEDPEVGLRGGVNTAIQVNVFDAETMAALEKVEEKGEGE